MKKSILYSLHGFIWFCDLSIIFLVSLAGNLWVHETPMTEIKNQDTQGDDYKITKLKVPVLFPL
ncbi:MAG: hypothetical protein LLF95_00570 [Bacteroidales bacterium]|nr:hypothetical protein [Bacteroidales bacterium]